MLGPCFQDTGSHGRASPLLIRAVGDSVASWQRTHPGPTTARSKVDSLGLSSWCGRVPLESQRAGAGLAAGVPGDKWEGGWGLHTWWCLAPPTPEPDVQPPARRKAGQPLAAQGWEGSGGSWSPEAHSGDPLLVAPTSRRTATPVSEALGTLTCELGVFSTFPTGPLAPPLASPGVLAIARHSSSPQHKPGYRGSGAGAVRREGAICSPAWSPLTDPACLAVLQHPGGQEARGAAGDHREGQSSAPAGDCWVAEWPASSQPVGAAYLDSTPFQPSQEGTCAHRGP